jgi:hypothetical protein
MFVVDITIWPHGNEPSDTSRELDPPRFVVANDGTEYGNRGSYDVWLEPDRTRHPMASATETGYMHKTRPPDMRVVGFPRGNRQSHLPALVSTILNLHATGNDYALCWDMDDAS